MGRFSIHRYSLAGWLAEPQIWLAGPQAWLAGPQAWLDGPEGGGRTNGRTDGRTDEQTYERTENLPILQDFVPIGATAQKASGLGCSGGRYPSFLLRL